MYKKLILTKLDTNQTHLLIHFKLSICSLEDTMLLFAMLRFLCLQVGSE